MVDEMITYGVNGTYFLLGFFSALIVLDILVTIGIIIMKHRIKKLEKELDALETLEKEKS